MRSTQQAIVASILSNPLAVIQLLLVGSPLTWLVVVSFHSWNYADPVGPFEFEAYLRLLVPGPGRSAFLTTGGLLALCAALTTFAAIPVAFTTWARPYKGYLLLALLAVPSVITASLRAEGWRNISRLIGCQGTAWAAVPSMVANGLPFAALLMYLAIKDLQISDVQLARIQGVGRIRASCQLWAWPIFSGFLGTLLFSVVIISGDLSTPSELYRGSVYLLADELKSRFGIQAWSHLAADSALMVTISLVLVTVSAWLLTRHLRTRHEIVKSNQMVPVWVPWLCVPAVVLVIAPIVGLLAGSFSDRELVLSFQSGGSFRWWKEIWLSNRLHGAFLRSVIDLGLALGIGIPLGVCSAIVHWYRGIRGLATSGVIYAIWFLPWLVPPSAFGIAAVLFLQHLGLSRGLFLTGVYHGLFVAPVSAALCVAKLSRIGAHDLDLATILNIPRRVMIVNLVLREISWPVVMAGVIGFGIVFMDVSFADLMTGRDETIPVVLRGISRSGGTPVIDAVGSIMALGTFVFLMSFLIMTRKKFSRWK